jgi:AraC family transcriptional regulator of adaptative response / DNA-3-methyladenine glycosylase II
LPVTEVAGGAGFNSLRSFHRAILATFGRPPRDLRKGARRGHGAPGEEIRLCLPYRPPIDWTGLLAFLAARALPGVEEIRKGVYRRAVRAGGRGGLLSVRQVPGAAQLEVSLPADCVPALLPIVGRLERLFDLDADPEAIGSDLSRDPLLAPLVARRQGGRIPGAWDPFETAVRAVLGQQVSVRAATTLAGRIVSRFGEELPGLPLAGPNRLFPTPEVLAAADIGSVGLPAARAGTLRTLARSLEEGSVDLTGSRGAQALERELREIPGIGPWTAQYLAIRLIGEPDAFPDGDLALLRVFRRLGAGEGRSDLLRRAEGWRPWRAYATLLLWSSEENR